MPTKQFLDEDGLAIVAAKVNEKLKVLATMPTGTVPDGLTVLYNGTSTATYKQGHIYKYDLANTAWLDISPEGGIIPVATMPSTPDDGATVLYVGATTVTYTANHLYRYNATTAEWVDLTATVLALYATTFTGTRAEWDALTTAEKQEYDTCNLTDDTAGGELIVSDEVTAGDLNPVTSNAVAGHIVVEEWSNTNAITVPAGSYTSVQTGISSTKTGYSLITVFCLLSMLDGISTGYRMYDGKVRISLLNAYTGAQTIPANSCTVQAIWMKN